MRTLHAYRHVRRLLWALPAFMVVACSDDNDTPQETDTQDTQQDSNGSDTPSDTDTLVDCVPGEYQDSNKACHPCPEGTFSDSLNASECQSWSACWPGSFIIEEGSEDSDRRCQTCNDGSWDHDNRVDTLCVAHTVCQPGTYASQYGSHIQDTVCVSCESGSFSDTENAQACEPHTECLPTQVEKTPPSPSSDRVCEAIEWERRFGTMTHSTGQAVAAAPDGGVYVSGRTYVASNKAVAFVRKYAPEGTLTWERILSDGTNDSALGLAVNANGVVVVGDTNGVLTGNTSKGGSDAYVIQLNAEGAVLWRTQFGTPERDTAKSVAVSGNQIFVVGTSQGQIATFNTSLGNGDGFLARLDSAGLIEWTRGVGSPEADEANAVMVHYHVLTGTSYVYVAGITAGDMAGGSNLGEYDAFVRQYGEDGDAHWTRQYGTVGMDYVTAITDAFSFNACVTGMSGTLSASEAYMKAEVRCYDLEGNVLWSQELGGSGLTVPSAITMDGENLWVFGTTTETLRDQTPQGESDLFMWRLSAENGQENEVTLLGTEAADRSHGIAWSEAAQVLYATGSSDGSFSSESSQGEGPAFLLVRNP